MSRRRSAEVALRDAQIRIDAGKGASKTALAARYGVSVTRICQILAEETNVSDNDQRAWLFAQYQGGIERLEEIIITPGRPITSGAGKHVIDETTGMPAFDPSPVVDAIRTKGQYLKSMAQLMGSEKMPTKVLEQTKEWLDTVEDFRETNRQNAALRNMVNALQSQLAILEKSREDKDVHIAEIVDD